MNRKLLTYIPGENDQPIEKINDQPIKTVGKESKKNRQQDPPGSGEEKDNKQNNPSSTTVSEGYLKYNQFDPF